MRTDALVRFLAEYNPMRYEDARALHVDDAVHGIEDLAEKLYR